MSIELLQKVVAQAAADYRVPVESVRVLDVEQINDDPAFEVTLQCDGVIPKWQGTPTYAACTVDDSIELRCR